MTRLKNCPPLLFLAAFLCFHAAAAWGDEKPTEEILSLMKEENVELGRLKKKIAMQNRKIASAGKKATSLLKTLVRLEDRLKLKERELKLYKWNIEINKRKILKLAENTGKTRKKLVRQKAALRQWLRAMYKEGGSFPIKVLFSAGSVTALAQHLKFLELVAAYDSALFRKYAKKYQHLKFQKGALLEVRSSLMKLQRAAEKKKKEIEPEKINKLKFLQRLKKEKRLSVRFHKELVQASLALNDIILQLEEKLMRSGSLDLHIHKGRLTPPVNGRILNRFGRVKNKQLDSYVVSNGISFKASKGTPVRAVYSGQVLYTGSLEGYGNLLIVGHGGNYHSVYGHLDKIIAKTGKNVGRGEVVALSGDSGSIIGETLYFELRHNGQAIEPTAWFRLAKK